jgi:hypothetical protein
VSWVCYSPNHMTQHGTVPMGSRRGRHGGNLGRGQDGASTDTVGAWQLRSASVQCLGARVHCMHVLRRKWHVGWARSSQAVLFKWAGPINIFKIFKVFSNSIQMLWV